jgi:hypothetical protein
VNIDNRKEPGLTMRPPLAWELELLICGGLSLLYENEIQGTSWGRAHGRGPQSAPEDHRS